MTIKEDRNFDNLIHRLEKVVYDSPKGNWRLQLLKEDLQELLGSAQPLIIWDAGCGFAQIGHWFAEQGHSLTLCDVSEKMLARAEQRFRQNHLPGEFYHASAQELASKLPDFDLVLFHAVLEWTANPMATLSIVSDKVKSGGFLSLLFYNRNAMIYKNTLKGGWRLQQVLSDNYLGKGKKLTPPNPQYPHEVLANLEQLGFTIITHTGIRVFHDYLSEDSREQSNESELFELEYKYCRMPVFRDMGRYIHVLALRSKG